MARVMAPKVVLRWSNSSRAKRRDCPDRGESVASRKTTGLAAVTMPGAFETSNQDALNRRLVLNEDVVARPTVEHILAWATAEHVVAGAAEERIVAVAAEQHIITIASVFDQA